MQSSNFRGMIAVALVLTMTALTTPVSAADLFVPKSVLGSVSGAGRIDLRGRPIAQEGTLFAGDSIRAKEKSYAKVLLRDGSKIEVGEKTEININPLSQGFKIAMATGTLGFTAAGKRSLRVGVEPFEIIASDTASGNISVSSNTAAGVRALSGELMVRNLKTSESFVLLKGQERWFSLKDGSSSKPLAEIASNMPGPVPMPQTPAGRTGGGSGLDLDAGAWAAIIAGGAVTGLAIWGLVVALDNKDELDKLNDNITKLQGSQTSNTAAIAALQRAQALGEAAFNARLNALAIASTAAQAQIAVQSAPNLTAAQRGTFATRAQGLASQVNDISRTIIALENAINALEAQIAASGTITPQQQGQLDSFRTSLNTAINQLNTARNQETQLLSDLSNAGVQGVTQNSQNTNTASASVPN